MEKIICRDSNWNLVEVNKKDLSFRPAIYSIILKDRKILLTRKHKGYDLPGGGLEIGETIPECAVRECKEETGLDIQMIRVLDCKTSFYKHSKGHCSQAVSAYVLSKIIGGNLSTDYFDENEKDYLSLAEWVDISRLDSIKILGADHTLEIIKQAIKEIL